jgi:hypothetical protein
MRAEVIVRFTDIGGIVEPSLLKLSFHNVIRTDQLINTGNYILIHDIHCQTLKI